MKIAFLATGDELVNGDILNTNGQAMCRSFIDHGCELGMQLTVSDDEADMRQALSFLIQHHQVVIITGGLGPTSDDRTRYALSDIIGQPLQLDQRTWQNIVDRMQSLNLDIPPGNKQQAMLPVGATILDNHVGTAAGCKVEFQQTLIYMLPGPPTECLPMFQQYVLPELLQRRPQNNLVNLKWRLFGVSEGEIAHKLDSAVKHFPCKTGYRWDYPYIEFKLQLDKQYNTADYLGALQDIIKPLTLTDDQRPASEVLLETLLTNKKPVVIDDQATGGLLATMFNDPEVRQFVRFTHVEATDRPFIKITGLEEFWDNRPYQGLTSLEIHHNNSKYDSPICHPLPLRGKRVLKYAVEYIAKQILVLLQEK